MITASIKGGMLHIQLPIEKKPQPSKSSLARQASNPDKPLSLLVAKTGGFVTTTAEVNGKPVRIAVNAIIPA